MVNPSSLDRARAGTVRQGGRDKAHRPMERQARRAALRAALEAWRRGDWFETHELLEPAWMGTDDPVERDLYQALIKLAAAYVHRARGNEAGLAQNLAGARTRLSRVTPQADPVNGVAVHQLLADIDARLPRDGRGSDVRLGPPAIHVNQPKEP